MEGQASGTVKICFLGDLRSIAGRREMEVPQASASTIGVLLNYVCANLDEAFGREVFDQDGSLNRYLSVFVNGKSVQGSNILETELSGGEVDVLILPIFDGG